MYDQLYFKKGWGCRLTIGFVKNNLKEKKKEQVKLKFEKASRFLQSDYDIALLQATKIVTDICYAVYQQNRNLVGKHAIPLDKLISIVIEEKIVPRIIAVHLQVFKTLVDEVDLEEEELQKLYVEQSFLSLAVIVDWFLEDLAETSLPLKEELAKMTLQVSASKNVFTVTHDENQKLASSSFAQLSDLEGAIGDDGFMIGKKLRLNKQKSFEHCVCVGPTGSGKTVSFFIPNLLSLPDASIVVTDPKGELFQKTAATNLAQGKRVLVFSPYHENSMQYNPLALCRNVSEIRELALTLLSNGNATVESITGVKSSGNNIEWITMSVPLLAAFFIFVKDLAPPKNTIEYALRLITENDIDTLKFLMVETDPEAEKQFNIFIQSAESEKTVASIRTVLASSMQLFTDDRIINVTSQNEVDPTMLREKPTVLYVIVPEHKSAYTAPLMATFYSQLMNHLLDTKMTDIPIYFMLDEFANIGIIPNIDAALATFRSRKIGIALGIQSLNQLKSKYEKSADTILDNLKTKFIFPGLSNDSSKYFSEMLGQTEITTTNASYGNELVINTSKQTRPLLTPDEIRTLADETLITIIDNKNPFQDEQLRYYKDDNLLKLSEDELDLNSYIIEQAEGQRGQVHCPSLIRPPLLL